MISGDLAGAWHAKVEPLTGESGPLVSAVLIVSPQVGA